MSHCDAITLNPSATIGFPTKDNETLDLVDVTLPAFVRGPLLGEGGMGRVEQATQTSLHRHVALKTLRPGLPEGASAALLREAWITGQLEHPNVVPLHDITTDPDGRPMLVMKVVQGEVWEDTLDDASRLPEHARSSPIEFHIDVLLQVADCLRMAHSKKILHRDLKPQNIMIGAFGEVYLLDWGVSIRLEPDPEGHLPDRFSHPAVVGTPLYMAPEMFEKGGPRLSTATDVYLLGGLLYRLLTRSAPRQPGSLAEMMAQACRPVPIPEFVPSDLRDLLNRLLAVNPDQRPSIDDFQEGLRDHLTRRQGHRMYTAAADGVARLRYQLENKEGDRTLSNIHALYGASRFGLEHVLTLDSQNVAAQQALDDLSMMMAKHELEQGSPSAAKTLLAGVRDPDTELATRIDDALLAEHALAERLLELDNRYDSRRGIALRTLLVVGYTSAAILIPVALSSVGWERSLARELVRDGTMFTGLLLAAGASYPWLRRSAMTLGYVGIALASPTLRAIGTLVLGDLVDLHVLTINLALMDCMMLVIGALVVDRRMSVAALIYLVGTVVASRVPNYLEQILVSASVLMFTAMMLAFAISAWLNRNHA